MNTSNKAICAECEHVTKSWAKEYLCRQPKGDFCYVKGRNNFKKCMDINRDGNCEDFEKEPPLYVYEINGVIHRSKEKPPEAILHDYKPRKPWYKRMLGR